MNLSVTCSGSTKRIPRVAACAVSLYDGAPWAGCIIALGQPAVSSSGQGHLISAALAREFGIAPRDGRQIGMCSIDLGRTPTRYRIPRMIIQKHQYEEKFSAAEESTKAVLLRDSA
jgi:hypothetical protein